MIRLSSADRSALIRLAASLPAGDDTRRAILSGLKQVAADDKVKVLNENGREVWVSKETLKGPEGKKFKPVKEDGGDGASDHKKDVDDFWAEGPGRGWPFDRKKVEDAVAKGADIKQITKTIQDGEEDLPPGASGKTKKLWDWMNSEME